MVDQGDHDAVPAVRRRPGWQATDLRRSERRAHPHG